MAGQRIGCVRVSTLEQNTDRQLDGVIALRGHGQAVDEDLLRYLSPLGWQHINLTGDYLWRSSAKTGGGKFRPLRPLADA